MYYLFKPVFNSLDGIASYTVTKYSDQMRLHIEISTHHASYIKATSNYSSPSYYITSTKENCMRIQEEDLPPKLKAMLLLIDTSEV